MRTILLLAGKIWDGIGYWLACHTMGWDGMEVLDPIPTVKGMGLGWYHLMIWDFSKSIPWDGIFMGYPSGG